jgi:hypothetical protein
LESLIHDTFKIKLTREILLQASNSNLLNIVCRIVCAS